MHGTVSIFMVLGVGGREAACLKIIRNAEDCSDFHGFESARGGGVWLQNHKKCMELLSFSRFWKWAGGGRLGSESKELPRTAIIFMSLEVGGRGASGFRIKRNAWDSQHFYDFGSGGEVGAGLRIIRNASETDHFHSFGSASNT